MKRHVVAATAVLCLVGVAWGVAEIYSRRVPEGWASVSIPTDVADQDAWEAVVALMTADYGAEAVIENYSPDTSVFYTGWTDVVEGYPIEDGQVHVVVILERDLRRIRLTCQQRYYDGDQQKVMDDAKLRGHLARRFREALKAMRSDERSMLDRTM